MSYAEWRKAGDVLSPARVVGLALEKACQAAVKLDISRVTVEHTSPVDLWEGEHFWNGRWSRPRTCHVPLTAAHQRLTLYLLHRLSLWLHGIGLAFVDAVRPKVRAEGQGHRDLILRHTGTPRYCDGFLTTELKIGQVGSSGAAFEQYWRCVREKTEPVLKQALKHRSSPCAAGLLVFIGICDAETLGAKEPPLLVRAQLLHNKTPRSFVWGERLLDAGGLPTDACAPPQKRVRIGPSWDEIRAALSDHEHVFDGIPFVPLVRLFQALRSTCKSPGQKLETYKKTFGFKLGTDFLRKKASANAKGVAQYWVSWAAAGQIFQHQSLS